MIQAPKYLAAYEGPTEMRIGLLLLPWIVAGLLIGFSRRLLLEDELEILINRKALAFAFYFAFFGLLAVYHLQAAGLIPAFDWKHRDLLAILSLLMLLGFGLSKMRYN